MSDLPEITDPNVLVGTNTADDAAVYRVSEELAVIQTVDFFTPVVDDPYSFGAIAAANSLSDVYAMGGQPAFALNLVGFPRNNPVTPMSVLKEILRGGAEKAKEAGIAIVGGHSVDDNEPKYGLCVTGFVHPDRLWRNVGARPGDKLVLTKPLGTGIITTALRAEEVSEATVRQAVEVMATLNAAAAEAAQTATVHACTDITGFGLLGHLREMLAPVPGSGNGPVGARVHLAEVPVLPETWELAANDLVPGGTFRNKQAVEPHVLWSPGVSEDAKVILCDAQTSGGLLFAVPAEESAALVLTLKEAGVPGVEVGEVTEDPAGKIEVLA